MNSNQNAMKDFEVFAQFAKGAKCTQKTAHQKCVIYTRVSSLDQLDNTSLQTQIEACRSFAEQNKLEIVGEFGGTYESAKSDEDRKEFRRMLTFLKGRTTVTKIIVYSLDRFSRTGGGAISIIENLKSRGIDVLAVTQPADTDTATGKLMQQINLIFSNFDNSLRRQKTISGMIAKMKVGYRCGAAPIGYINTRKDGEKIVEPDGKRSKLIKLAFQWKAEEQLSNEAIRKRLTARGWQIPKQTLSGVLKNPFYCGIITHTLLEGEMYPGKHKPLISKATFLKANEVNAKFLRESNNNPEKKEVALKRFMTCSNCGEPLRGYIVKNKGIWYYKCNTKGCKVNRNAKVVNDMFLEELKNYTLNPTLMEPVKDQLAYLIGEYYSAQEGDLPKLKKRLKETETKLDKIESKYLFDEISKEIYEKHHRKVSQEKQEIQKEIDRTGKQMSSREKFLKEAVQIASNLAVLWENGDYKDRQRVQKLVFPEGISYNRQKDNCRTHRVNSIFLLIHQLGTILTQKAKGQIGSETNLSLLVVRAGIEPATHGFSVRCSTN